MKYRLHFQGVHAPSDELIDAEVHARNLIPRIGEHVRLMGREYVVVDVVHELVYAMPGGGLDPMVVLGPS